MTRSAGHGPTQRAQPFYCPYCGEEDFVPFDVEPGRYYCNSCNRHFRLSFLGIGGAGSSEGG